MSVNARAAVFEIVERRRKPDPGSLAESFVAPNIVRVNGAEVAIPKDYPITVHELTDRDVAMVTLTVYAHRIFIGDEYVDEDAAGAIEQAHKALDEAQRGYAEAMAKWNDAVESARRQLVAAHRKLDAASAEGDA